MARHRYTRYIDYKDIDRMGHVHNAVYQIYCEEARIDLVRKEGYPIQRIEKEDGFFPLRNFHVEYQNRILYDDEVVHIDIRVSRFKNFSITFSYTVVKPDGTVAAEASSLHGFVDNRSYEIIEIPGHLRDLFEKYIER